MLPLLVSLKAGAAEHVLFSEATAVNTGNEVFIRAVPSKSKVYVGEPLTIEFLLYHRVSIIDPQHELTVKFDDVFLEEYPFQSKTRNELINGELYRVVSMQKYLIIPQLEGKLKVPAVSKLFKLNVPPPPNDFFGVERIVEKKVTSLPKTLDVLPLPILTDSIPFSKAIGDFKFSSKFRISDQSSAILTFHLEVSGKGSLEFSNLVLPELPDDVALYNNEQKNEHSLTPEGLQSKSTFTYLLAANFQGEYTIPAIIFLYFNPDTGIYERYVTEPFKWLVKDGALNPVSQENVFDENKADSQNLYLKGSLSESESQLFIHSAAFFIMLVLSVFIFITGNLYSYCSDKVAANPAHYLFVGAKKKAIRSLQKLKREAPVLDHDVFYKKLIESVVLYFCAKFYLPSYSFTLITLQDKLCSYNLPEKLEYEVIHSIECLYAARFSPNQELVNDRSAYCDMCIALIKTVDKYLYEEVDVKPALVY